VGVTALVAVKTSDSRPSGQRRHQQHRVGEMHFVELNNLKRSDLSERSRRRKFNSNECVWE
jgi:hypothetical protein